MKAVELSYLTEFGLIYKYVVHIRSLSIRGHIDDGNLKKALK